MESPLISLNRRLCGFACGVLSLVMAQSALADFVGVEAEIRTDLPICQATDSPNIEVPLSVCDVYAVFDDPADRLLSVGNNGVYTTDSQDFYQHPFNFTPFSPACAAIPVFPDLVCDTFITIGLECGPAPPGIDGTSTDGTGECPPINPQWPCMFGGWFNSDPSNGQGDAGTYPDLRVLLAQLSMAEGENAYGELVLYIRVGMETVEIPGQMFDCQAGVCLGSACPADVNSDGTVGAFDLASLLGAWGPCDNGVCRCFDADDDGQVGPADLAQLLGNWGPCP